MYFENDLPLDKTYKGIKPNPTGYRFDNRFEIEFDKENKTFYITDNPNYVKIYNKAISNFSCIVGRNGSGKTTFMELLIGNIAWGITPKQPSLMKSIYYNIDENGDIKFFLHQYINWDKRYKILYNDTIVEYGRNGYTKNHPTFGPSFSSKIPDETKFIFHSLSPFDKIFYSISVPLKAHPKRIEPFREQMKYVGNQNIFVGDPKHEIQTLTNLIRLFSNDYFSPPFKSALGYEFSRIEIDINHLNKSIPIYAKDFTAEIIEKITTYSKIEKYPELLAFKDLNKSSQEEFFLNLFYNETKVTVDDYLFSIVQDNILLNEMIQSITHINNFFKLISFSSIVKKDKTIDYPKLKQNILKITKFKDHFFIKDATFLNDIFEKKSEIEEILLLQELSIKNISKIENLPSLISLIRKLKHKDYLEFKLYLLKKEQEINYFYLSSGEKTMMSYFANLAASISDFGQIENKTFIILIDEVELHLHPEWQRNYIEYMNTFFRENKLNVKFQFIIATHSPFVLSDVVEEQIIFINEEDRKNNEHNTFGANIYDIFEKGFFLENSIGKCSENFINELSNILYLFKAMKYVMNDDFFLIRNFIQEFYIIDESDPRDIEEIKKDLDNSLKETIISELQLKKVDKLANKLSSVSIAKYLIDRDGVLSLRKKIKKHINIIGEPTIKMHLKEIYEDVKGLKLNGN